MTPRRQLTLGLAAATLLMVQPQLAAADGDPTGGKFTLAEATKDLGGSGKLTAVIDTSLGVLHCELFEQDAPLTVANFVGLARGLRPFRDPAIGQWTKRKFYDGLIFHRVIPGFMIQGGDVSGSGSSQIGYEILDEKNAPHQFDRGGVMAMANRGPNTGTSQFFVTEGPTPMLDDGGRSGGHYQIFGQCAEPELVKKIAAVPRNPMDRPTVEVRITKVTIEREGAAKPAAKPAGKPAAGKPAAAPAKKPPAKG